MRAAFRMRETGDTLAPAETETFREKRMPGIYMGIKKKRQTKTFQTIIPERPPFTSKSCFNMILPVVKLTTGAQNAG
ncbi:hypothetical protein TH62_04190 [Bacillus sp. TH008]|nr:hypothetical protein TH62_04190 [Bacillus sp. TH008]